MSEDVVNNPSHYTAGSIECLDFIEAWQLEFREGNVIKYVVRSPYKGTRLQDLKKAQFYLNRLIEDVEKSERFDKDGFYK